MGRGRETLMGSKKETRGGSRKLGHGSIPGKGGAEGAVPMAEADRAARGHVAEQRSPQVLEVLQKM